jgi:hypothetical protein
MRQCCMGWSSGLAPASQYPRLRRALQTNVKHLRTARAAKRKLFGHYYLVGRKELLNEGSFAYRSVYHPAARFKPSDLADAAETRVSLGCCFRFAAARDDGRRDYCPHPKTFVRSPMKFAAATSRHDWSDLDSL